MPTNEESPDDTCKLPQVTGPCRGYIRRWSYDASKGSCVEFIYGGCGGNANNFESKDACEAKCGGEVFFSVDSKLIQHSCDQIQMWGVWMHRFAIFHVKQANVELIYHDGVSILHLDPVSNLSTVGVVATRTTLKQRRPVNSAVLVSPSR